MTILNSFKKSVCLLFFCLIAKEWISQWIKEKVLSSCRFEATGVISCSQRLIILPYHSSVLAEIFQADSLIQAFFLLERMRNEEIGGRKN